MKILAIANAHALAHVSRLLEIAKVLRPRGHTVCSWDGASGIPCAELLLTVSDGEPALAYIESKTVAAATWHLVRFGRYAGWIQQRGSGEPRLLGTQLAMGPQ